MVYAEHEGVWRLGCGDAESSAEDFCKTVGPSDFATISPRAPKLTETGDDALLGRSGQ